MNVTQNEKNKITILLESIGCVTIILFDTYAKMIIMAEEGDTLNIFVCILPEQIQQINQLVQILFNEMIQQ